jgi:anti-sigma factor RsiW
MKHEQFKEWLQLSTIDELKDDERALLDIHLGQCSACQVEFKELEKFHSIVGQIDSIAVSDTLLLEARQQLRTALLERRLKKSLWKDALESIPEYVFREHKIVFGGVAMAALGMFIGYVVFVPSRIGEENIVRQPRPVVQEATHMEGSKDSFTQDEARTSNLQFIDSDAGDGIIEFTFDAVTPMRVRGNVNDDRVQKVLARALTNEENAGVRLRTVSAIASRTQSGTDPEVKAALISALKQDVNPGVRQEALRVLLRYPLDKEVKQALMYTLTHDKNSGIRIAAINGLASASMEGQAMDQDVLKLLKQKTESDNNNYVRRQARTVIQEVAYR